MSGTTPIYALPYPDFSDNVSDGASDIQSLAIATEKLFEDRSGFVKLIPPNTGHLNITFDARGNGTMATGITTIHVNNVFTSQYNRYRVVLSNFTLSSNSNGVFAFRTSTGLISSNYYGVGFQAVGGSYSMINENNSSQLNNYIWGGNASSVTPAQIFDIITPSSSGVKTVSTITIDDNNNMRCFMGTNSNTSFASGFLIAHGSTVTSGGRLCIYAWK